MERLKNPKGSCLFLSLKYAHFLPAHVGARTVQSVCGSRGYSFVNVPLVMLLETCLQMVRGEQLAVNFSNDNDMCAPTP